MNLEAASTPDPLSPFEQLRLGREIMRAEGQALLGLAERLSSDFCRAVNLVLASSGSVIVTGMGKAGLVGQKIAATLTSTGTPSHFLHPAEAIHGDLGRVQRQDVVIALSYSGESDEVVRLLPLLRQRQIAIIAITRHEDSSLGRAAEIVLELGELREACALGLAPSTSTTAMLAMGDALALVLSRARGFRREDFARVHPGGSLGRKLARVDDVLRSLASCRVAAESHSIREILVQASKPGRRSGAIMLTDDEGKLTGLFTDSDLARLLERRRENALDEPVCHVMTRHPRTIESGARLTEAVALMADAKISELPVVDRQGRPLGLVDITDLVSLFPSELEAQATIPISIA